MTLPNTPDPAPGDRAAAAAIEMVIVPRVSDLGDGFQVRRALPSARRQMVGPFIFLDSFGPVRFNTGTGLDVRPHPHIGLATVTYLMEGEIFHRDSLGSARAIRPGDLNWMTAGRGIVHSERTSPEVRAQDGARLQGLQAWVALPKESEEMAPDFAHHPTAEQPVIGGEGKSIRLVAGSLFGQKAPVRTASSLFYADVLLDAGASVPLDAEHEERALYLLSGQISISGDLFEGERLLVFHPGDAVTIKAEMQARFVLLGGAPMDGPRYIWWNFVSSSKERIELAREDWAQKRFDTVPGDGAEFIPAPKAPPGR